MRSIASVIVFDILLGILHIFLDIYLAYSYFENVDNWWGILTLLIIVVPGTLEFLCYSIYLGRGEVTCCEWLTWAVLFGPILFPLSLVVWHIVKISRGKNSFNKFSTLARSHILNNMTVLTKNCMQLILQGTIFLVRWNYNMTSFNKPQEIPNQLNQIFSIIVSTIMIAKTCADHYYFEKSGKNVSLGVGKGRKIKRMLLNIVNIILRGGSMALLFSMIHFFSMIFLFVFVVSNYVMAKLIVNTQDESKHIWTAFGAILLPNCFISKDTVENIGKGRTEKWFKRFLVANSWLFFILFGIIGVSTICGLSYTDMINYRSSPASREPTSGEYWMINSIILLCSLLHAVLVTVVEVCC